MNYLYLYLFISLYVNYCSCYYDIIKLRDNQFIYMIKNGHAHLIPDEITVKSFDYDVNKLDIISNKLFSSLLVGAPIVSNYCKVINPDEVLRYNLQKITSLQLNHQSLLEDSRNTLQECINPSIIKLKNGTLGVCVRGMNHYYVSIAWLDENNREFSLHKSFMGIEPFVPHEKLNVAENNFRKYIGEDPRLILSNNSVFIISSVFEYTPFSLQLTEMYVNSKTNKIEFGLSCILNGLENKQKNWIPFNYKSQLLFIQNINPTIVYGLRIPYNRTYCVGMHEKEEPFIKLYSKTDTRFKDNNWQKEYGEMRGGTPAILINNNEYLTFFHSNIKFPYAQRYTYFMGAFIFSSKPPFHITKISPVPIIIPKLYDGAWEYSRGIIDYVIFPISFIFVYTDIHGIEFSENELLILIDNVIDYHKKSINFLSQDRIDNMIDHIYRYVNILLTFGHQVY